LVGLPNLRHPLRRRSRHLSALASPRNPRNLSVPILLEDLVGSEQHPPQQLRQHPHLLHLERQHQVVIPLVSLRGPPRRRVVLRLSTNRLHSHLGPRLLPPQALLLLDLRSLLHRHLEGTYHCLLPDLETLAASASRLSNLHHLSVPLLCWLPRLRQAEEVVSSRSVLLHRRTHKQVLGL
jgi:hypothetical protein